MNGGQFRKKLIIFKMDKSIKPDTKYIECERLTLGIRFTGPVNPPAHDSKHRGLARVGTEYMVNSSV